MRHRRLHVLLLGMIALSGSVPPAVALPQLDVPLVPPFHVGPVPPPRVAASACHPEASSRGWSSGHHCQRPTWRPRCHTFVLWGPLLWGIGAYHAPPSFEDQARTRRPAPVKPRTWRRSDAEQDAITAVVDTRAISTPDPAPALRIVHVVH